MSRCRSCRAEIVWAKTRDGKAAPFERDPKGVWTIVDGVAYAAQDGDERYTSHFATCPQAATWRGAR